MSGEDQGREPPTEDDLGMLVAGVIGLWLGRSWPDLVVGLAIAVVAPKGGVEILTDARRTRRAGAGGAARVLAGAPAGVPAQWPA